MLKHNIMTLDIILCRQTVCHYSKLRVYGTRYHVITFDITLDTKTIARY